MRNNRNSLNTLLQKIRVSEKIGEEFLQNQNGNSCRRQWRIKLRAPRQDQGPDPPGSPVVYRDGLRLLLRHGIHVHHSVVRQASVALRLQRTPDRCRRRRWKGAMNILQIVLLLTGCAGLYSLKFPKKPHIVFMIVDDLGWNDVSFHGSKQIPTPNIDAVARDGIILNQYYVQPSCSPSRGSLMTGKYPIRIGFQHDVIKANAPWGLPLKEKVMPQYLKALKYSTHAVGKWHLGFFKEEYLPLKRGFDSFFGFYTGVEDYFTHFAEAGDMIGLDLHDGHKDVWRFNGTYGTDLFTYKAKRIILEHDSSKPLFLYFAQQAPHSGNFKKPLQAPEKYVKPMVGIDDEKRHIYAGMVSALDNSVGEIFSALDKSGMLDDTLFIFTTDNGGAPQEADGASGSNWPLKGSKYNLWEGGVRGVSFLWSPLLRHKSRIYGELMHISDWLPTILSAVGGPEALKLLPRAIDGVDQWPSLVHVLPSPRAEILLNIDDEEGVAGIRRGQFKLVKGSYYEGQFDKWYDPEGRIFDVTHSIQTPHQKKIYKKNYIRFLRRSKAARVLWKKYGKDPRLTFSCLTPACKEKLEVKCGVPPPVAPTCDAQKEPCLFDVSRDPCEFYNIAEQLPEVASELELAIEKYRSVAVPPEVKPADPKADPKLHGNAWVPWK